MSESGFDLGRLSDRVPEVRGALVFESSGIEVASWGDADPEVNSAELAELMGTLGELESIQPIGKPCEIRVSGDRGQWLLFTLGREYVLAILADPGASPGKVRFYAESWIAAHQKDFS